MSADSKNKKADTTPLQFRLPRDDQRGVELAEKLEKIAKANGLSMNVVANMAMSAGISMVETKLSEIHQPAEQAA